MKYTLLLVAFLFLISPSYSQIIDSNFVVTDGEVTNFERSGDLLFMSGNFNYVGPSTGPAALINRNSGTVMERFPKIKGYAVNAAIPDGKGGLFIGGAFESVGGVKVTNVAHILSDNTIDKSFIIPLYSNYNILTMVLQGDTLFVGGAFSRPEILAINIKTREVTSIPCNIKQTYSMVLHKSKLILAGYYPDESNVYRAELGEIDLATSTYTSWNVNIESGWINALCLYNNTLYAGGSFTSFMGQSKSAMVALNPDTRTIDNSFNPNINSLGNGFNIDVYKNKFLISGGFNEVGGQARNGLAIIDPVTGELSEGNVPNVFYTSKTAVIKDTIYLAGQFKDPVSQRYFHSLASFDISTNTIKHLSYVAEDKITMITGHQGNVLLGGRFHSASGKLRKNIACIDVKTNSITPWDIQSNGGITGMVSHNGKLYVAGSFTKIKEQQRTNLACVDMVTGNPTPFNPNVNGFVNSLKKSAKSLWFQGRFTQVLGQTRNGLAEIDLATETVTTWNNSAQDIQFHSAFHVDEHGVYISGGNNDPDLGYTQKMIALDRATGSDLLWEVNSTSVNAFSSRGDTLFVGGYFDTFNGQTRNSIAAVNCSTGEVLPWSSPLQGSGSATPIVHDIFATDSVLYLAGSFVAVNNQWSPNICGIRRSTGEKCAWSPYLDDRAKSVKILGDALFTGGSFTKNKIAGNIKNSMYVARYNLPEKEKLYGKINGHIYASDNGCSSSNRVSKEGWIVMATPGPYFASSDAQGNYSLLVKGGTYQIRQVPPPDIEAYVQQECPSDNFTATVDLTNPVVNGLDFYSRVKNCPALKVDITSNRRRRCFTNLTTVTYYNDGNTNASNVEVNVFYPEYVHPLSSTLPWNMKAGNQLTFNIGTLPAGTFGSFTITDSVICGIEEIRGLTQCTKATIGPKTTCTEAEPIWDHSSIEVAGNCQEDGNVSFTITNTGTTAMSGPSEYRVYYDNVLGYKNTIQLTGGQTVSIDAPANGKTLRLEADQRPGHPGKSRPRETIEACGDWSQSISKGFVMPPPQDDADADVEIDCQEIRDSYDPNDKLAQPSGVTSDNHIQDTEELEYMIRFQNTGNDVAYTVIIKDTLSEYLDISKFRFQGASHPVSYEVSGEGKPVLTFIFRNILLPDSASDPLGSIGYVKFKISQIEGNAIGTVIKNKAYIYFDYNSPIITNETNHMVWDQEPTDFSLGNDIVLSMHPHHSKLMKGTRVTAVPNPFQKSTNLKVNFTNTAPAGNITLILLDMTGRRVHKGLLSASNEYDINGADLTPGIYLFRLESEEGFLGVGKLIKK